MKVLTEEHQHLFRIESVGDGVARVVVLKPGTTDEATDAPSFTTCDFRRRSLPFHKKYSGTSDLTHEFVPNAAGELRVEWTWKGTHAFSDARLGAYSHDERFFCHRLTPTT